jgi:hypothetical protein
LTEGADLFEASKWAVDADHEFSQLLYDAGVSRNTKTAAQAVNCDLVTSGIVRKSARAASAPSSAGPISEPPACASAWITSSAS